MESSHSICMARRCDRAAVARNCCSMHLQRLQRHGDANYTSRRDDRPAIIDGDIAKIPLGINAKDGYAIVDKEFAYLADEYKWSLQSRGYATTLNGTTLMHREIINPKGRMYVDHINGDKLDNRKSNLRELTNSHNLMNSGKQKNNTSGFRGVHYSKKDRVWIATVGETLVGRSKDLEEAAVMRDCGALQLYGDVATLNIL